MASTPLTIRFRVAGSEQWTDAVVDAADNALRTAILARVPLAPASMPPPSAIAAVVGTIAGGGYNDEWVVMEALFKALRAPSVAALREMAVEDADDGFASCNPVTAKGEALRALAPLWCGARDLDPTPPFGHSYAGQRWNRWEAFALDYAGWLMHLSPTPDVRLASRLIERVSALPSLDALRSALREVCGVEVEAVVGQAAQARAAR